MPLSSDTSAATAASTLISFLQQPLFMNPQSLLPLGVLQSLPAYWFPKTKTDWKLFRLVLFKMDVRGFRLFQTRFVKYFSLAWIPLRNVRSTPFWLTSSNTWPPTGRLRMPTRRWAAPGPTHCVVMKPNGLSLLCENTEFVSFCSCSQWSGRSSSTSTTSLSSSQWWANTCTPKNLCLLETSDNRWPWWFNSSVCCRPVPGAFPAIPGHVPEGQCEGGGLQIHHGSLHKVGPPKNSPN